MSIFALVVASLMTGAFWTYGREMRIGKWLSISVLWLAIIAFRSINMTSSISVLLAAFVAGLVLVIMGHLHDKARIEAKLRERTGIRCCEVCRNPLVGPVNHCEKCGTAVQTKATQAA
ncbi:MAG: hypothetical protein PF961_05590 [Planctomycetota bacterium]|jgi:hypothetical protein|nr:hypothetical protein [Planctomycetota bacterium]